MPPRKAIPLQFEVTTDDEWQALASKEGLTVIDVFTKRWGPCLAVLAMFRNLQNEYGTTNLSFALAEADDIEALTSYRGRSKPMFLLMVTGGILVDGIHGVDAPRIMKGIKKELELEMKALAGERDRVTEWVDIELARILAKKAELKAAEEAKRKVIVPVRKAVAFFLIKPDLPRGRIPEVKQSILDAGFIILKSKEVQFDRDMAEEVYGEIQERGNFPQIIDHAISGASQVLILTQENPGEALIFDLQELVGPEDVDEASRKSPESLRGKHAIDNIQNAFFVSSSKQNAMKAILTLFPYYRAPYVKDTGPKTELSLLAIGPPYLQQRDIVLEALLDSGATICRQRQTRLSQQDVDLLCTDHKHDDDYQSALLQIQSGVSLLALVERDNVIDMFTNVLGDAAASVNPKVPRKEGLRLSLAVKGVPISCLHSSSSLERSKIEVERFFPEQHTLAIIKPDAMDRKAEILEKIAALHFTIVKEEERTLTPSEVDALYQEHKEREYYTELREFMTSAPVLVMVLLGRGGIFAWRDELGPAHPDSAREIRAESLRAVFGGNDKLHNALHGSDTVGEANREIIALFGEGPWLNDTGVITPIDSISQVSSRATSVAPSSRPGSAMSPKGRSGSRTGLRASSKAKSRLSPRPASNLARKISPSPKPASRSSAASGANPSAKSAARSSAARGTSPSAKSSSRPSTASGSAAEPSAKPSARSGAASGKPNNK